MNNQKPNYTFLAVILALGFIIGAFIISRTWKSISRGNVTITVTGSASKDIRSDYSVWTGVFSRESNSLTSAYEKLRNDNLAVKEYLKTKGIGDDKMVFSSVNTTTIYGTNAQGYETKEIAGYRLTQDVTIESSDVDMIDKLSREASELIVKGIEFNSNPPQFLYTKLSDLKIEMIALASQDAKVRAEQIAKSTGNEVGDVRSSKTGVIQINAKHSTEVSDYGMNNTTSLEKTITSVVNISFSIE
ncbi:MAG: SIMPL domain-containing protein [Ignavibacteria bacterium]